MSKVYNIEESPLIPCGEHLVVRRLEPASQSQGRIYLSEGSQDKPPFGIVLALGAKIEEDKLRIGVCVHFGKYAGTEVVVNRQEYLLIRESEIDGIVANRDVISGFVNAGVSV